MRLRRSQNAKTHRILVKALNAFIPRKPTLGIGSVPSGSGYFLWAHNYIFICILNLVASSSYWRFQSLRGDSRSSRLSLRKRRVGGRGCWWNS